MKTWYAKAEKYPMHFIDQLPARQNKRCVILHTNGGGADIGPYFDRPGNTVASHFQVWKSGRIQQFIPINKQAYAQFAGNQFAVSIETEDDGHDTTLWTDAQIKAIVGICEWVGVPARMIANATGEGGGVGFHEQFPSWNLNKHDCPGTVREKQIHDQILPALGASKKVGRLRKLRDRLKARLVRVRKRLKGQK